MANVAVTAAKVGLVDPKNADVKSYIAGSTITKGQVVAMDTDGTVDPADSTVAGGYLYQQVQGIALCGGGAGQAIDVCQRGELYGFTVSGMNPGALLWLSETAGALSDADVGVTTYVGRVSALADKGTTNVVMVQTIFAEALPT